MSRKKCLHQGCEKNIFQKEDKCIFHCEKNTENNWYKINNDKKNWDEKLVKEFWKEIREKKIMIFLILYFLNQKSIMKKVLIFSKMKIFNFLMV